jgi:quercetin dioxygenase-like cupin family protein
MRAVFEPGWKWSVDVAPIAGTASCQAQHLGYVISGRMRIRMEDGSEDEVGPGDFLRVAPGHDAWVLGDEPCVMVDFGGVEQYAQRGEVTGTREAQPTSAQPTSARPH